MHLDPLCLPFHLCSLMIFVVLYLTFGRDGRARQVLINFISVVGTLGSVCAILIPTNGTDFTTPDAYQCFVYHAGLLWFALHLILSGRARLGSVRTLGENIGILLALTFVMLYINGALAAYDTNFFYLTRPPMENLPVLNLAAGWYAYFLRLIALAARDSHPVPPAVYPAGADANTKGTETDRLKGRPGPFCPGRSSIPANMRIH